MDQVDLGKTSTGLDAKVAGLLCYLAGWVTGLIFFLIEKENKFVRFHAMQSIIVFGSLFVLNLVNILMLSFILPYGIRGLLSTLLYIIGLILWIVLMIKAYQGEKFKVPIAGDIAEQKA